MYGPQLTAASAIATWAQSAQQPPAPAPVPAPAPRTLTRRRGGGSSSGRHAKTYNTRGSAPGYSIFGTYGSQILFRYLPSPAHLPPQLRASFLLALTTTARSAQCCASSFRNQRRHRHHPSHRHPSRLWQHPSRQGRMVCGSTPNAPENHVQMERVAHATPLAECTRLRRNPCSPSR